MKLDECHPQSWFLQHFLHKTYLLTSAGIADMYSYKFWITVRRNQKHKLVSSTRNRVLWWCREPTCMFTPLACMSNWTNQLPLAAHPGISFSLDITMVQSHLQRGAGWLVFSKYSLISMTLQLLVCEEKWSRRACKKTLKHDCLFPGEFSITSTESTWRK